MALDVIITPASGLVDFQNSGISSATIQLDGSGNLNISAAAGDIQIGDTSSDVYIGDGVNNVDIVFEQSGEIRGLTGKTITLGQSDSFIAFAGNVTGDVTFTGKLVFPDNGTVPDDPTNEQYDYITFGANGSISQVSGRGALMITSSDDSLILANGDVGKGFTSSDINVDSEHIFLLSDYSVIVKTDLQNGWGSENTYTFSGGDIEATTFTSTQATGTAPFTVSSTTVVSNLNADTVDGLQASSFLRSDADDTTTGNLVIDTNTNTKHLYISRSGSTSQEYTRIGRDDTITYFSTKNDESTSTVRFSFDNTDTESGGGANANNRNIELISDATNARILIDSNLVWHAGNDGSGSTLDADLLDGQEGSYYTNASNISSGTLDNARLPQNISVSGIITANSIVVEDYRVSSVTGSFTASVGVSTDIDTFTISTTDFKTTEYTLHFTNGTNIQSQKVLVMQNGTNAYAQEYAIMYEPNQIVSIGATISGGICKLQATPETGITGVTTYRFVRGGLL